MVGLVQVLGSLHKEKVDYRRKEKYARRRNLTFLELRKLGRNGVRFSIYSSFRAQNSIVFVS